ncbi:hypothetical protein HGRIS_008948 [Hohenbuehelia grisea]|uniref:Uncharacterized protein n=1 Tax=Hohenbuehelia grisea TaxID=104357 RepID=A0ABR3J002_9AGAR
MANNPDDGVDRMWQELLTDAHYPGNVSPLMGCFWDDIGNASILAPPKGRREFSGLTVLPMRLLGEIYLGRHKLSPIGNCFDPGNLAKAKQSCVLRPLPGTETKWATAMASLRTLGLTGARHKTIKWLFDDGGPPPRLRLSWNLFENKGPPGSPVYGDSLTADFPEEFQKAAETTLQKKNFRGVHA